MTDVVCDAGPLIHLDELDLLDLLFDFEAVALPGQVAVEFVRHRSVDALSQGFDHVRVAISERADFVALVRSLGLAIGEQAALSWAVEHPGSIVLTDDSAARLAARGLGVRAYGTLGILLRSVRRGLRAKVEVLDVLRSLPERSTLFVRSDLLHHVIEELRSS